MLPSPIVWRIARFWSPGGRRWCGSAGASAVVHAAMLAVLSCILTAAPSPPAGALDLRFVEPVLPEPVSSLETPTIVAPVSDAESGGGRRAGPLLPAPSAQPLAIRSPVPSFPS